MWEEGQITISNDENSVEIIDKELAIYFKNKRKTAFKKANKNNEKFVSDFCKLLFISK